MKYPHLFHTSIGDLAYMEEKFRLMREILPDVPQEMLDEIIVGTYTEDLTAITPEEMSEILDDLFGR
jgi:hypothetical protein